MKKLLLLLFFIGLLTLVIMAACSEDKPTSTLTTIANGEKEPTSTLTAVTNGELTTIDAEWIFQVNCAVCHVVQGDCEGVAGDPHVSAKRIEEIVRAGDPGGVMPSFQGVLTEAEIKALVAYLATDLPPAIPLEIVAAGPIAVLFWDKCSGCHGDNRQGGVGPALIPQRLSDNKEFYRETISFGQSGTAMPAWQEILTELEIDNLIDYILSPVQATALTWDIDDMRANSAELIPIEDLPSEPIWGGKVEDLMVVTERDIGRLLFIDSSTHEVIKSIEAGYAIHAPTFTPKVVSDRWLWAIARNGWLIKVDLYSLQVVGRIRVGLDSRGTAVSTDGKYVIVGNYIPNTAVIIETDTLKPMKVIETSGIDPDGRQVDSRVAAVLSTPIGPYFEFALKDAGQVWVVDYSQPDFPVIKKITDVGRILHDGFLTPDGRYFQIASQEDGIIAVIDLEELEIVEKIPAGYKPHPGPGALFESGGRILAATPAIGEGLITIWDTATWEVVKTLPTRGPGLFIRSHPESRYVWVDVAFGDYWDDVVVFDKDAFEIVATLQPGKRSIHPEFTKDGEYVYIACWNDNKVVVYDANSLELIAEIQAEAPSGIFNAGVRQEEPGA